MKDNSILLLTCYIFPPSLSLIKQTVLVAFKRVMFDWSEVVMKLFW